LNGDRLMTSSDQHSKERNRAIAQNEANRQTTSAIRVSTWAIGIAVVVGVIAAYIAWAWLNR
jgi:Flp pilus assembly protein TadB